jgi:hypothetical protein
MYHIELRHFPHNHSRFNLSEREVSALAGRWVRDQVVELGERKWIPQQAKLMILEGPQLAPEELSMGRGWRTAQRQGEDVTERVLGEARRALAESAQAASASAGDAAGLADPLALGVQLASLLGEDPSGLLAAWRAAAAARPELPPSETLALAEREIAASAGNHH